MTVSAQQITVPIVSPLRPKSQCQHNRVKQVAKNKKMYQCLDCGTFIKK